MRYAGLLLAVALAGCGAEGSKPDGARIVPVTIEGLGVLGGGRYVFQAELADTPALQEKGLMYRADLKPDGGMLFAPYPASGGPPQVATFWMKNTPTPLDIVFIRPDGTIARIAENTLPFSEAMVSSGEPVSAVLELVGGRSAETGVSWGR